MQRTLEPFDPDEPMILDPPSPIGWIVVFIGIGYCLLMTLASAGLLGICYLIWRWS